MEKNIFKQFSFDLKKVLIDEIALEGLEGIGFDLLWRRIEKNICSLVTEKMKNRFWSFIVNCETISFYQIPEPLPYFELKNRVDIIDEDTGNLLDPKDYLDGPYEYCPLENEYGSCKYYHTRKLIPKEKLKEQPYEKIDETYKNTLVMVASIEERWKALAPHKPFMLLKDLTKVQYCILELIGRSRENGQMTIGKTNITKIIKDSKLVFYNRKYLQDLDLIKVLAIHTVVAGRAAVNLMLCLIRFQKPFLENMPKHGKFANVIKHLLKKPNYTDNAKEMMSEGVFTQRYCKRLYKSQNIFVFEDHPDLTKNKKHKEMTVKKIHLELASEESSQSDNETNEEPLKCQYKIKVSLMRQAYKQILEAGVQGLSLLEMGQLLGIEFYTARTISRVFKSRNIVREHFVDKGKQKIAKYVAVAAASTAIDTKYEEEKLKFLENIKQTPLSTRKDVSVPLDESDEEIPVKKLKLEKNEIVDYVPDSKTIKERVVEVKHLDGYENIDQPFFASGKCPTLRQLKFANGILKLIREKQIVIGYQTLNNLVSNSIKEAPMDVRSLKVMVQKLVSNGQIKLIKMSWPLHKKTCIVLCAPQVQANDPLIKAKYKEINLVAMRNKGKKKPEIITPMSLDAVTRPLAMTVYPRYMKMQKLHEAIMKFVYFNDDEMHKPSSSGFCALVDLIPEFTVDFVLGCMNASALVEMFNLKIPNHLLHQKVRDIPANLLKIFLTSYNLQNSWRQNLKNLAMLGLIQLIRQPNPTNEENFCLTYEFYANPRAKIIDTTGEWPRQNVDIKSLERYYNFTTFADVDIFWKNVYKISTSTEIALDRSQRIRKIPLCIPVLKEEVCYDTYAEPLGDGKGPCGFDASFHMELPRSWTVCQTQLKQQALLKKVMPPSIKHKKTKVVKKRTITKKTPKIRRKVVDRKQVQQQRKRRRSKVLHIKWTKEEDELLMLCIAAANIISPAVTCYRIRNHVAKELLTIYDRDKLPSICHKRATFLESNSRMTYEKDCVINELKRRHTETFKKYEDLLKVLRLQYSGNWSKIYPTVQVKMLELVWILYHLIKSKSFNQKLPCVALSLEDFYSKFSINNSSTNKELFTYKTSLDVDPKVAAIKEGIIFSLMAAYKPTPCSNASDLIHGMFSPFPEVVLRPAITQLRKAGAVAAKEKFMANALANFHTKDLVQSSYKISTHYERRWICRLNADFITSLMRSLDEELPRNLIKGSSEINCILSELKCCNIVDLEYVTTPAIAGATGSVIIEEQMSVLDMILNLKLKSGNLTWSSIKKFQKVSELIEDCDYEESFEELKRNSLLEINENYDMEDTIVKILTQKKEQGITFKEIQTTTGCGTTELVTRLRILESSHIIKRVGYYENLIVLTKYAKPWTMRLKDQYIIPTPWLTLDVDIKLYAFINWSGTVMNKIFMNPGCSIAYISDDVEFLSMRATQDICKFLEKCKCVYVKCIKYKEPDLFSEDDLEAIPELEDFNEYDSVQNILIFPVKDALIRYAHIRTKIMYERNRFI